MWLDLRINYAIYLLVKMNYSDEPTPRHSGSASI